MEKPLNSIFLISLEEIALRRIAIGMFSEPSILAVIAGYNFDALVHHEDQSRRGNWFYLVQRSVLNLHLPEQLEKRLNPVLEAVGLELLNWRIRHHDYLFDLSKVLCFRVLKKLRWTTAGMVDSEKTAEELVRFSELDILSRFELACFYCLEAYIPMLWKELPEEDKRTLCGRNDIPKIEEVSIELFLPYIERVGSKYGASADEYSSLFECSALCGRKAVAKYLFSKLTNEERKATLVKTAKKVIKFRNMSERDIDHDLSYPRVSEFLCYRMRRKGRISEVIFYLLSLMTPQEQIEVFKELPDKVLFCFLDWPWHDLFFAIADIVWAFLPEELLHSLVREIVLSIKRLDYYFPSFFQNLFRHSPVDFREQFVGEKYGISFCFWKFFENRDSETMSVVLRSLAVADRLRFVLSTACLELVFNYMNDWPVMEVFLREAILTKGEKERLKQAFMEYMKKKKDTSRVNVACQRFFDFLDEPDESQRRSNDEASAVVK